jgi:predicted methyltransferase
MAEESTPEEKSMAEESTTTEKPKRRGRPTNAAKLASLPPFDATLTEGRVHATAKQVIRTGQYESFDVMLHADFERDPRFSVRENLQMLNSLVVQEVRRAADELRSQIQVER